MATESENRIITRRLFEHHGIMSQADIKPGMMFATGDRAIMVIDSVQMVREPCDKLTHPFKNRRYMIYTKFYKNRKRKTYKTQVSNLYNRAIKQVIIK